MPLTTTPQRADQELTGAALSAIREARQMYQRDVAKPLGMTTQAWQKYEAGERKFTLDRVAEVLRILGSSQHELEVEKARILGGGAPTRQPNGAALRPEFVFDVYSQTRPEPANDDIPGAAEAAQDYTAPRRRLDLRQILGPNTDALEVANDSMFPWAEPGEIVLFDRDRYPKRGAGCVVETRDGALHVRHYEKSDGSTLFVRELFPEPRVTEFALKDVRGVYGVRLRGD